MNKQKYIRENEPEIEIYITKGEKKFDGSRCRNKFTKLMTFLKYNLIRELCSFKNLKDYPIVIVLNIILTIMLVLFSIHMLLEINKDFYGNLYVVAIMIFSIRLLINAYRYRVIFKFKDKKNNIIFYNNESNKNIDKKLSNASEETLNFIAFWIKKFNKEEKAKEWKLNDITTVVSLIIAILGLVLGNKFINPITNTGILREFNSIIVAVGGLILMILLEILILNGTYLARREKNFFIKRIKDRIEYFK